MNIDIANGEPGVLSEVIPCGAGKAIIDAVVFDYDAKSGEAGGLEFPGPFRTQHEAEENMRVSRS